MAPLLVDKEGVSIFVRSREHLPPHIHAFTGGDEALVEIRTGEIYAGYIPGKKLRAVQAWLDEGKNRDVVEENFYELNELLRPNPKGEKPAKTSKSKNKHKKKGDI
jgi:hypothetical protein